MSGPFILIASLNAFTPQGQVSAPVRGEFKDRSECVAFFDTHLQAMRQRYKGPTGATFITYCEVAGRK